MVLEGNTTGVRPRGKGWWDREYPEDGAKRMRSHVEAGAPPPHTQDCR